MDARLRTKIHHVLLRRTRADRCVEAGVIVAAAGVHVLWCWRLAINEVVARPSNAWLWLISALPSNIVLAGVEDALLGNLFPGRPAVATLFALAVASVLCVPVVWTVRGVTPRVALANAVVAGWTLFVVPHTTLWCSVGALCAGWLLREAARVGYRHTVVARFLSVCMMHAALCDLHAAVPGVLAMRLDRLVTVIGGHKSGPRERERSDFSNSNGQHIDRAAAPGGLSAGV